MNYKGGYQIIDLTSLNLVLGTSQVSITDKGILDQLRDIREYIEDNYNFAIPLNKKLKPILLRIRDKKNGEKQESSIWADLSIFDSNLKFKIEAVVDHLKDIQIEVVFEKKTDDDGNPYYDIKTAKYLYTANLEAIDVLFSSRFRGDLQIDGDLTVNETSEVAVFENITDKDGHKRFIEGDITINTELPAGVTIDYKKWSLSGTHLLVVIVISATNTTEIPNGGRLGTLAELPQWIKDKIVPVWGGYVTLYTGQFRDSTWAGQNCNVVLSKSDNAINLNFASGLTLTTDKKMRVAFDLLIDNASE